MNVPLTRASPALFPPAEERRRVEDWLTVALLDATQRLQAGPVTPTIDMEAFREALLGQDFREPQELQRVLEWIIGSMQHGIVQMNNPRYFGLFNPGATFPAQCADRIASVFNPQLASSASSPVPVALESHIIRAVGRRAGLEKPAAGHFATGGSEANYTALLCALTAANPGFAADGIRAYAGPLRFYTSKDCHIAWLKIAHQAGVGRAALRLVDTDGQGRLDPQALRRMIAADRAAGAVPVMIVATAGTTNGGMIDPLAACADMAASEGVWYHVDAAWGGAALASDRLRGMLAGIERADSITIDAHKWLATTMGCAMFLTTRDRLLPEVFHCSTNFMPSSLSGTDPYLNSVQWSRHSATCAPSCGGWSNRAGHGWRRPVSRAATWYESASRTARRARPTWRIWLRPSTTVENQAPMLPGAIRATIAAIDATL